MCEILVDVDPLILDLADLRRELWEEAESDRASKLFHRAKRKLRRASLVDATIEALDKFDAAREVARQAVNPARRDGKFFGPIGPMGAPTEPSPVTYTPAVPPNGDDLSMPTTCEGKGALTPGEV